MSAWHARGEPVTAPSRPVRGACGHRGHVGVEFADLMRGRHDALTAWCATCARRRFVWYQWCRRDRGGV